MYCAGTLGDCFFNACGDLLMSVKRCPPNSKCVVCFKGSEKVLLNLWARRTAYL